MLNKIIPAIEKAFDQILSLDPQKQALLKSLDGHPISINITDYGTCINLIPEKNKIKILNNSNINVSAELTASSLNFLKALFNDMPQMLFYSKEIKLKGSLKTVLAWQRFYIGLSPELSYWLEPYLGKTLTYQLSKPLQWLKSSAKSFIRKSNDELTEFLQEEALLFPPKEAVEDFRHDLLLLGVKLDQLEHKLNQLKEGYSEK
ncbi:SCP2 sterol-binding domain-containing protein [Thiotrichales bacterium 19S9-12]|nr:SCP2 sterol-binding domain-containing protein [Thiotrichales bacterium 19S9-11]MCF6812162.1 SCP2 sterol-binding domain-containing protein [Thiotrichales bacterium 19S9-12]